MGDIIIIYTHTKTKLNLDLGSVSVTHSHLELPLSSVIVVADVRIVHALLHDLFLLLRRQTALELGKELKAVGEGFEVFQGGNVAAQGLEGGDGYAGVPLHLAPFA